MAVAVVYVGASNGMGHDGMVIVGLGQPDRIRQVDLGGDNSRYN